MDDVLGVDVPHPLGNVLQHQQQHLQLRLVVLVVQHAVDQSVLQCRMAELLHQVQLPVCDRSLVLNHEAAPVSMHLDRHDVVVVRAHHVGVHDGAGRRCLHHSALLGARPFGLCLREQHHLDSHVEVAPAACLQHAAHRRQIVDRQLLVN